MLNEKVAHHLDSILLRMMDKVKQCGFNGVMAAAHMNESREIISLTRVCGKWVTEEALAKPPAKLRLTACFAWRFVS